MAQKKYDLNLAVFKRWLRTVLPQVPAVVAYVASVSEVVKLPAWVFPTAVLLGTLATALDKYLREIGFYDEVGETLRDFIKK